ncbi:MAG: SpoIIE family protein phosphatase [Ruminococcus sp.]|nr:SpoIIE family protein phosphatase [Ruminococcus sp.]
MAYKELVKKRRSLDDNAMNVTHEVILHITYFISGVLVSKGAMLSDMSPFGASFLAAVPFMYMPAGLLGSVIGYLIKNPIDSFRYIAVIISIGALRWVLNEFKKVSQNRFFPCAVAFVPVFVTSLALTFSSTSEITQVTMCLMEATLSAAGAYFMSRTVTLCNSKRSLFSLSSQELACIAMTGCILLLSFGSLSVGNISIGRALAVLIILFCAKYGYVSGGCIAGVATGIVFSLAFNDMMFLCAGFAFSGLMGGLFAPVGKLAVCACVIVCNLTLSFSSNDSEIVFAILIECIVASVIFILVPKSFGNYITNIFANSEKDTDDECVRRSVIMRLNFASKALSNVSSCVNSVSEKLSRLYTPNAQWIYDNASNHTCTRCGMRYYCFEKQKTQTNEDFHSLTDTLKKNGFVKESDIEENFKKKCCRATELVSSINQSYKEYQSCESARRRITQIRSVVAGQFAGLSDILEDLSDEFSEYEKYDSNASQRVLDSLQALSLSVADCSCKISKGNKMIVEVELILNSKMNISKGQVTHEISRACGRRFESPQLSYEGDRARMTLCERPCFDLEIGSSQHICNDGELCGDCLNYFNNGMGSTVLILSDGMGTGGTAAVDSNMATSIMSKLLKAGLSYDCALQVVNSSLMIKSEEESLATLDVIDFNLFTGKAQLFKAGACITYIKKNSKIYRKDMSSLPVGILNEVKFAKEAITLTNDDLILMVSDGVLTKDDKWIEKLLMSWGDKSMEELSFAVVDEAKKHRNGGHDDDITALAVRVMDN